MTLFMHVCARWARSAISVTGNVVTQSIKSDENFSCECTLNATLYIAADADVQRLYDEQIAIRRLRMIQSPN